MAGVWTKERRARQAFFERRRYPANLKDGGWKRIGPLLPAPARGAGRGRAVGQGYPVPLPGRYPSASASLTPSAANAPANVRRIQVSTRGRATTWSRTAAANSP